jgi:hypothetical protein
MSERGAGKGPKAAPAQAASAAATSKNKTRNTDRDCSFFTKVIRLSPTEIPSSHENGISAHPKNGRLSINYGCFVAVGWTVAVAAVVLVGPRVGVVWQCLPEQ